jgi:hypothetical protein
MAGRGAAPTTYTIYGVTPDEEIYSVSATYSSARSGTGLAIDPPEGHLILGQDPGFYCYEVFIGFDTSAVVGTITSATLSLHGRTDASTTDFTVEARLHDWGATLTTADWVAGGSLGTKTLLASLSTVGFTTSGHNVFTSEAAFVNNINQSGVTRMLLCSSRMRVGDQPSVSERVHFYTADDADQAKRPKLVVVTA